jgi:hypothetical protein
MLERFLAAFPLTDGSPGPGPSLTERFGGCTFGGGIYRIHTEESAAQANGWVAAAFEKFGNGVSCFGFDWLGRQFAADYRDPVPDPPVVVFEPGTGEVLEIPVPFSRFHDDELVEQGDAALALTFFERAQAAGLQVSFDQCAGYRVPLFLGGKDEVENLDVIDLDVYWTIHGQLIRQLGG